MGELNIPNQQKVWDELAGPWKDYRVNSIDVVEDFLKDKKGKVLDLGCGSGRNFLQQDDLKWFGVDFSKEMLKHAKDYAKNLGIDIELKQSEAFEIPYGDAFFDIVNCVAVLHCISPEENREKTLREIYRVLKTNGRALITVWDKNQKKFENSAKEKIIPWEKDGEVYDRYYYFYEKEEFRKLLESVGFKVVEIYDKENLKGLYSERNLIAIVEKLAD